MRNFSLRTAFGVLYAGLWLGNLWLDSVLYTVLLLIAAMVVSNEFLKLNKSTALWKLILTCGLSYGLFQTEVPYIIWAYVSVLAQVWIAYQMLTQNKLDLGSFQSLGIVCLHICFPIMLLLHYGQTDAVLGRDMIIGILLLVWATDSFAFLMGSWLGKRPLYTKVSPNKTVEGALAALCFTPFVGFGIAQFSDVLSTSYWMLLGILTAGLAIIGDLAQSHIKRIAQVKDSGNLMPGHGGLYDRMDSLIFVVPFLYIILYYLT